MKAITKEEKQKVFDKSWLYLYYLYHQEKINIAEYNYFMEVEEKKYDLLGKKNNEKITKKFI